MPDIQDLMVKAIQSYANTIDFSEDSRLCILALAESMSPHIINELGLKQEWAVGTFFRGKLDDIDDEDTDPQVVMDSLEIQERADKVWLSAETPEDDIPRRALMTRITTGWAEEVDPEVDEHLLELVANEEVVLCANGGSPDAHDWRHAPLEVPILPNRYECKNCEQFADGV
jgi:hypothetical protein